MLHKNLLLFLFILIPMIFTDCVKNPVTGKKQVTMMSQKQEQAIGDQSDPSIVASYGLYEDQAMQEFINKKGKQMGLVSHRPDLKYTFRILDSPVVNAFALPGGYVYFTRGIMGHFNNEAEFAGVLGHEIGHITARHSAQQYTKQMFGQIGLIAGIVVSPKFAQFAQQASQGLSLMFLKFGRDDESESDKLGVEYSTKIGYDAHEMADFFKTLGRLQSKAGANIPDFLSSHPNPVDRFGKVHEHADEWQQQYPQAKKVNTESFLRMIDGLVYGEDPKQGFVENNVFYHPELKFQFPIPNGWSLQNSPSVVQMAPEDGKAMMQFTVAQEKTRGAAATKLIEEAKLKVIERQDNAKVNGFPALVMISEQVPPQAQGQQQGQAAEPIRIMSFFIEYGGLIYTFHGMSSKPDFNRYTGQFKQSMTKFDQLKDPAKLNKKPKRIKVAKVQSGGTLKEVLTSFDTKPSDLESAAILNGMQLNQQVSSGTLIKVITNPNPGAK